MSRHDAGYAGQPALGPDEPTKSISRRTALAGMAGATMTVAAVVSIPTIAGAHPDAVLLALEQEHDQVEASIKGLSEEETDRRASRVWDLAIELWESPAHTPHGVAAKLRVLRYHAGQLMEPHFVGCADTCLACLEQIGGAS